MIKQNSIDEVRFRADIEEVISHFIEVKKHLACCPFHGEKTPSFHIWQKKQVYKCFGCGESGDVFRFVMKHQKKTFTEAVEWLAAYYKINIEYDQPSAEESQQRKDDKTEMLAIVDWANKKYIESIERLPADSPCLQYLAQRGFTKERIAAWCLGFAPQDWKFLATPLINMGKFTPAVATGIIRSRDANTYDALRLRVTIPLFDHNGILVGIAGRIIPGMEDTKTAKYLNPDESIIYQKKALWYGLHSAQHAIKQTGSAYIVEGYFDVMAMHDAGVLNTVSPCGTEADLLQLKFLKRYADELVFLYDGDKPGIDKMMKQIDLALQLDIKTRVVELPDGMDPDEFIKKAQKQTLITNAA